MTRYATLFDVDLLHDYFLNRGRVVYEALDDKLRDALRAEFAAAKFLEVFPTAATSRRLAGQQMLFRTTGSGFVIAVKTDASDIHPALPLGPDLQLDFALRVRDPLFFNYTGLTGSAPPFYRFGNDSGNSPGGTCFLSAPIAAFDASHTYEADDCYAASAGGVVSLFRAVRDSGPSAAPVASDWMRYPTDTFDATAAYAKGAVVLFANRIYRALVDAPGSNLGNASQWEPRGALSNQYASSADRWALRPPVFDLDLSGAALASVTVRVSRPGAALVAAEQSYAVASGVLGTVQVNLLKLTPGAYRLEVLDAALSVVPGLGFDFYLDAEAARAGWFGVIAIGAGSGDFALLDGAGALRAPHYTLRFLNRATRWRYIFPAAQTVGVGAEVAPEGGDSRILVTDLPRPMTRFGDGLRLQADVATTPVSEEVRLPEPGSNRIRRQTAQWYSETYMSNLPL